MPITSISQLDFNKIYTYADYLTWQFDEVVELIKGRLYKMTPAPLSEHQRVSGNVFFYLFSYFKNKPCQLFDAPFDVRLPAKGAKDEDILNVFQPDICVICDESKVDRRGCLGAPDLIVEILSQSTAEKDLKIKYALYEEAGVQEYWIAIPQAKSIQHYHLQDGKYVLCGILTESDTITSKLFPDLSIALKDVFEGIDKFL